MNFVLQYMQIVSDEVFGIAPLRDRLTEELWRTLKWVPKVQGLISRISQAKGQRQTYTPPHVLSAYILFFRSHRGIDGFLFFKKRK